MPTWPTGFLPKWPHSNLQQYWMPVVQAGFCWRRFEKSIRLQSMMKSTLQFKIPRSRGARGFTVVTGFIPGTKLPRDSYDLVLVSHVISHIADPVEFLAALADVTAENGRVVIFSHDGRAPGADHLFADVEFSFCREHLGAIAAKAGLELLDGPRIACAPGQLDKQVLVFQRRSSPRMVAQLSTERRDHLLEGRRQYFRAWEALADRLAKRVHHAKTPVLNFGASFWALLLAAYCPQYWERVDACVVDGGDGKFLGKPVIATQDIDSAQNPIVVLGVNPSSQAELGQRLAGRGEIVIWNDLLQPIAGRVEQGGLKHDEDQRTAEFAVWEILSRT